MGSYEVTFADFDFFVRETRRREKGDERLAFPADDNWGRGDRPVINVSWPHANAYTQWPTERLNLDGVAYRLHAGREWEYAARAGTDREYAIPAPDGGDTMAAEDLKTMEKDFTPLAN